MTGYTREPRRYHRALLVAVLLTVSLPLANSLTPHPVNASPGNFPVNFYLHKQSSKTLNTITTTLWANATQSWSAATQTESRSVRNTQPGQWDHYSQPALAGNMTLTAPATVHFWMSASITRSRTTLATTLFSVAPWGAKTSLGTVSTTQTIGTSPSEFTITIGTLSLSTLPSGYILNLETVLTISGNTLRTVTVSYDTAAFPDRLILIFVNHWAVNSLNYSISTMVSMPSFSRNGPPPQRMIVAEANVSDSLGLYHIAGVTFTATSPVSVPLVNNATMNIVFGGNTSYWGLWRLTFPYSSNDTSGTYQGSANVFDLNGNTRTSTQFSFRIFASWNTTIRVLSSPPNSYPIQHVLVTATSVAGVAWSELTSALGMTSGLLEDGQTYNITAYWEGGIIGAVDNVSIIGETSTNLTARVHFVSLAGIFQDYAGRPLDSPPQSMSMTAPNGTIIHPNPSGSYFLQDGAFLVDIITWKGINVAPLGTQVNPASLAPLRLNVFDLSLAAVNQDSIGLGNANVTLVSDNVVVATGTTDPSGIAFFHQLPGGDYVVTIESSQGRATKSLTLDRTQTTQVQISGSPASPPPSTFDLYLFGIILGSAAALLGGVFGIKRAGVLKFSEHGFDYLNNIVGGRIPQPASLLVGGDAGSGKTLFCEQIAADWLGKGRSVVFFSYQSSPDQIRKSMSSLGVDVKSYESLSKLALVDCYSSPAKIKSSEKYLMENPYDLTALGIRLSQALKDLGEKQPLVVIDPISALFSKVAPSIVVSFLEDKAARVKGLGGDALYALGRGTAPKEALGSIEASADGILDLSVGEGKRGLVRSLRVRKMRNQAFKESSFDFRIRALKGIRFLTKRFG